MKLTKKECEFIWKTFERPSIIETCKNGAWLGKETYSTWEGIVYKLKKELK